MYRYILQKCEYRNKDYCSAWVHADALVAKGYGNIDKTVEEAYAFTLELNDKIKAAEHRAEVAERALRKAVSVLDAEYRAFGVNRENKTEQRIKNFIEQAEKELAEEK